MWTPSFTSSSELLAVAVVVVVVVATAVLNSAVVAVRVSERGCLRGSFLSLLIIFPLEVDKIDFLVRLVDASEEITQ